MCPQRERVAVGRVRSAAELPNHGYVAATMIRRCSSLAALVLVIALTASACGTAASTEDAARPASPRPRIENASVDVSVERTPTPPTPEATTRVRSVGEQGWAPFARAEGVTLRFPSARVELVAFHQANHDGARQLEALPGVAAVTLETRERGTGSQSAADVVVDPAVELRAPVTGLVKRAGTYVLYCEHSDDYVVIAPDERPNLEVKLLHIDGVRVRSGDRVVAGETVLAPRPTRLPFESQVDELSVAPSWPHIHMEVVDPSIPDRPSPGGGCR